ncbi:double-stranded RNA-binding protein 4 [Phtheirospermum japonicum]|uniref:Double-stranded RNA-binding protein 4 n=1 Tax=Phtheirospermum japonicum TaxID=374723 RepID=A0A830C6A2_9LAMI|nr:double-stranded RNA-binding protein 4 [Phtheirospermum japonicum]
MYKSKLQELCQRRSWELPEYSTVKDGPDHMPRFTASVTVHGQVFDTPAQCKSSKDAQNTCARIAFDHFNALSSPPQVHHPTESTFSPAAATSQFQGVSPAAPPPTVPPVAPRLEMQPAATVAPLLPLSPLPSSLPTPPLGFLTAKNANAKPANGEIMQQNCNDTTQTSMFYRAAIGSNDSHYKDTLHMYKNQLQQFAQKKNFDLPVYTTEAEGPPHSRRFKSSVSVDGKSYETLEFFTTLKEAEQAAARVACQVLSVDAIQEDGGLYKNLLQELAQKKGLLCPLYESVRSGLPHRPSFVSTVEIGSRIIRGAEAKTKKQAEMNAAKAAYCALMESCPSTEYPSVPSIGECNVADSFSQNVQPSAIIKENRDATAEEGHLHAKRAKSSKENMTVNNHLPDPSEDNSVSDDSNNLQPQPVKEQPVEEKTSIRSKTVVCPRKSSLPKPECASVLPFSDDEWIAYNVEQVHEPTAEPI